MADGVVGCLGVFMSIGVSKIPMGSVPGIIQMAPVSGSRPCAICTATTIGALSTPLLSFSIPQTYLKLCLPTCKAQTTKLLCLSDIIIVTID